MSEPAVLTEVADGVMTITINRPQAKNAVNKDVAVGIAAALDALDADDNTCLLYTSPSPRDRYGSRMPSSA